MAVYSTTAMAQRRRFSASLVGLAIWALATLLPACAASQEWIYDKPRVTPAQLDRDKTECRKIAPSRGMFRVFEDEKVDRAPFNRCMERRGYTVTVAPLR